jgi:hypothetical protein
MSLADAAWLSLWERAAAGTPRRRRRELLATAGSPDGRPLDQLEVGRANARLLRLHMDMFGPLLACTTQCPACGEALEMDVDAGALLARGPAGPAEPARLRLGSWDLSFRPPTEGDLDAVAAARDPAAAKDLLLQRCVLECFREEEAAASASLVPPEVVSEIGAEMEKRDPLAALELDLQCAGCGHAWSSPLEVDAFLWTRLDAWARRLLRDIHTLASRYGWSEESLTAMSQWRRQTYLDLVDG